jgi:hypothetical protein
MKARDSSNSASVSDIGSPIDPIITALVEGKGNAYFDKAISLLEPLIGRFWMVFPTQIVVLSYFPGPKITAWSLFDLPFTVDNAVTYGVSGLPCAPATISTSMAARMPTLMTIAAWRCACRT